MSNDNENISGNKLWLAKKDQLRNILEELFVEAMNTEEKSITLLGKITKMAIETMDAVGARRIELKALEDGAVFAEQHERFRLGPKNYPVSEENIVPKGHPKFCYMCGNLYEGPLSCQCDDGC